MVKNGWIKHFEDGKKEFGFDEAIKEGFGSWSKGRLEGMVGASLAYGGVEITVEGTGDYWQADVYEVREDSLEPRLVRKVLAKQISDTDDVCIACPSAGPECRTLLISGSEVSLAGDRVSSGARVGDWVGLVIETDSYGVGLYVSAERP